MAALIPIKVKFPPKPKGGLIGRNSSLTFMVLMQTQSISELHIKDLIELIEKPYNNYDPIHYYTKLEILEAMGLIERDNSL